MRRRPHERVLIGIDAQSIDDVESSLRSYGSRYLSRVYTEHEQESCQGESRVAAGGLAARFAAKEAVIKLLGGGDEGHDWRSIEVHRAPSGRPEIRLHGRAAEDARRMGADAISLSLSHDGNVAVAAVTALAPRRGRGR